MEFPLEPFDGPLDLLLHLIEQEELDITAIALAAVCESYLAHLKEVEERTPEEVADFLVIATKLLYLKSLELLPEAEVETSEDATGLAEQLRIYRAFVEASHGIVERFSIRPRSHAPSVARLHALRAASGGFAPPPRLIAATLAAMMASIIAELEPIVRIPKAKIGRVISIEDRIAEVRALIASRPRATLEDVLRGRTSRAERIVAFLAILELMRREEVTARQEQRFAPIAIQRISHL